MKASLTKPTPATFYCVWGEHRAPTADAADDPATTCLGCLDEIAELERRDRVAAPAREIA